MIKYTIKDVKALAAIMSQHFTGNTVEDWIQIVVSSVKSVKEKSYQEVIKEAIYDLIGPYSWGFNRAAWRRKGMDIFLFRAPLKLMPLYIESDKDWERVISQWRLSIER